MIVNVFSMATKVEGPNPATHPQGEPVIVEIWHDGELIAVIEATELFKGSRLTATSVALANGFIGDTWDFSDLNCSGNGGK